jgi:hypothetical protein
MLYTPRALGMHRVVMLHVPRALGMDESLFVRLEKGGATCELNVQYRMNR